MARRAQTAPGIIVAHAEQLWRDEPMTERQRSYWGWGWEDRFPGAHERRDFAAMMGGVLGIPGLEPREPTPLAAAEVRASRFSADGLPACCVVDRATRAIHTWGRCFPDVMRGFFGDFSQAPDAVAFPTSEEDIATLMAWCADIGAALIPWGGGTSVVGGVTGHGVSTPVVAMNMRRMDRLLEVDRDGLSARVQAGATGPVFEEQLRAHGLTFRHFPQSYEFSTVGGWIATRAGGHYATGRTHIDDFVASTRTLTPAGVMETWRLPGSGAGPSPDRMIIGSEGALGVITEAWLRVQRPPRYRSTVSPRFKHFDDAVNAVRAVAQSELFPSNCRLLDAREAMINQVEFDGSAVLVLAFESADHSVAVDLERAMDLCRPYNAEFREAPTHRDSGERSGHSGAAGSWRNSFINAPYLLNVIGSLGGVVDTFETAITWDRFAAMHKDVVANVTAAMREHCGGGSISCRFTHAYPDGPAPYYTFIAPGAWTAQIDKWTSIKQAASDTLSEHGATITHHHAVGRVHRPWYDRQRPELFGEALRAVKAKLDPQGLLNPGVLIDAKKG